MPSSVRTPLRWIGLCLHGELVRKDALGAAEHRLLQRLRMTRKSSMEVELVAVNQGSK